MEQRFFHGDFTAQTLAGCLISNFNRGNLKVQVIGENPLVMVQIASKETAQSGGKTALSLVLQNVEDGVAVELGQQSWLGLAASMGFTALIALKNPFNLITRVDDLAQDLENIQLTDEVWKTLEENSRILGTGYELTTKLKRLVCEYCNVANLPGEPRCIACGAPLGNVQLNSCMYCGYMLFRSEGICPNCGKISNRD